MTKLLTTTDIQDFTVTVTPEAYQAREDALTLAKGIVSVTDAKTQADAISASSLMKGLTKEMEKTRTFYKEKVLAAGRLVDNPAKSYSAELETEIKRVEKLASDWQAEENRKAAAIRAEQERQQQAEREQQKRALAEIARQAEAERRANLAAIAAAPDETTRQSAQEKADRDAEARAEEVRLNQEACAEAERQRLADLQSVKAEKPQAARVVVKMDFEIKDLRALYAARPDLVELTPKRALILAAISIPGHPVLPGVYEYETTAVQAKAS